MKSRSKFPNLWLLALVAFAWTAVHALRAEQARAIDPQRKAVLFDVAASGGSTANVITSSLTPLTLSNGTRSSCYRITVELSSGDSVFNMRVTRASDSKTITMGLNGGTALTAGNVYTFTVGITQSEQTGSALTYNFSATSATRIGFLLVEEVQSDGI